MLLDGLGLNVEDGVPVLSGDAVEERVPRTLGPVVTDGDVEIVVVLLPILEALIDFVSGSVKDNLLVTDEDEEALGDFVCVIELVVVFDIKVVPVSLIEPDPHAELVDVLEEDIDLVNVGDAEFVLVACVDCVVVLVALVEPVVVTDPVEVLELLTLRELLGDPVEVLEEDTDCVPVTDTSDVPVDLVVFVKDGEAEDDFDGARVLVSETLAVVVLEGCAVLLEHGLELDVFELVIELLAVFVSAVERVDVVELVIVLDDVTEFVFRDVEEEDFDIVPERVEVIDAVTVLVLVVEIVLGKVGKEDREEVVVFVDVLDCVED